MSDEIIIRPAFSVSKGEIVFVSYPPDIKEEEVNEIIVEKLFFNGVIPKGAMISSLPSWFNIDAVMSIEQVEDLIAELQDSVDTIKEILVKEGQGNVSN